MNWRKAAVRTVVISRQVAFLAFLSSVLSFGAESRAGKWGNSTEETAEGDSLKFNCLD